MGAIKVALVFDSDDLSTSGFGTYTLSGAATSSGEGGAGWITTNGDTPPASLLDDDGQLLLHFTTLVNNAQSTYDNVPVTPTANPPWDPYNLHFSGGGAALPTNAFEIRDLTSSPWLPEGGLWKIGDGSASDGITGDFEIVESTALGVLFSVAQLNSEIGESWGGGVNVSLTSVVVPEVDEYVLILTCLLLTATVGRHTLRRVFTNH